MFDRRTLLLLAGGATAKAVLSDDDAPQERTLHSALPAAEVCLRMAKYIVRLPDWTTVGAFEEPPAVPFTDEQWQAYLRIGFALQRTDALIVESTFLVYWCAIGLCGYGGRGASAKPMLLLRVMFDLPGDRYVPDRAAPHLAVCDGFSFRLVDDTTPLSLALPVDWTEAGPTLACVAAPGGSNVVFDPHAVFRAFAERFDHRRDLGKFIDRERPEWDELIASGLLGPEHGR